MEFENGATGVFVTTTGDAPGTNRLEISGTLGKLVCEDNSLVFHKLECDEREWCVTCKEGFRMPDSTRIEVETDGKNEQHVAVLNAFADHIENGGELVARGQEGINGLMLSNAMHLSAWTGKPVEFPFDEELFKAELMKRVATSRRKTNVKETFGNTEGTY